MFKLSPSLPNGIVFNYQTSKIIAQREQRKALHFNSWIFKKAILQLALVSLRCHLVHTLLLLASWQMIKDKTKR